MNFKNVYGLFQIAQSNKLRFPKIRLQTAQGSTVMIKLAGDQSKYEGQLQITDDRRYPDNTYYGRIDASGVFAENTRLPFRMLQSVRDLLERLAADAAKVASEYGRLTGNCAFCGLKLTDARSTAVGYGQICADHYGLPWGDERHSFESVSTPEHVVPRGWTSTATPSEMPAFGRIHGVPTVQDLLQDAATPYWMQDVIHVAVTKDPVDALHVFETLYVTFKARCNQVLNVQE